jgi:hypothetical protein
MQLRLYAGMVMAGLIASPFQAPSLPDSAYLTPESMIQAVALGQKDDLVPYRLRHEIGVPPTQKTAVYTPFIRVALAARAAKLRTDTTFDASRLPQWVTAPDVLVVFGAPCASALPCRYGDEEYDRDTPLTQVSVGPLLKTPQAPYAPGFVKARDISYDLSFLDVLGGPSFSNAMLAARFEPGALKPGLTLFARWTLPSGSLVYSGGVIAEADLRSWR